MTNYLFTFRADADRTPEAGEEQKWYAWFGELGSSIAEQGSQVSTYRLVSGTGGDATLPTQLTGYTVVTADSLDDAAGLAAGCPGLQSGGQVEVAEIVGM